jgi:hypothetical protein
MATGTGGGFVDDWIVGLVGATSRVGLVDDWIGGLLGDGTGLGLVSTGEENSAARRVERPKREIQNATTQSRNNWEWDPPQRREGRREGNDAHFTMDCTDNTDFIASTGALERESPNCVFMILASHDSAGRDSPQRREGRREGNDSHFTTDFPDNTDFIGTAGAAERESPNCLFMILASHDSAGRSSPERRDERREGNDSHFTTDFTDNTDFIGSTGATERESLVVISECVGVGGGDLVGEA